MSQRWLALVCVLTVSGCSAIAEMEASYDKAVHGPYCEKFGFAPDTPAWNQCVMNQSSARRR